MKVFMSVAVLCLALFVQTACASQGKPLTESEALNLLQSRIQKDNLYSSWTTISCLSFIIEETTRDYFDVAIREKHGGNCPGDPDTAPVADRYRVNRRTKQLQWYEPVEGGWRPYKGVLKARRGKEAPPKPKSADDIVRKLYHDFPADGKDSINSQTKEVLSRYFVSGIADLFIKIQECEKREGGICGPDFMLLYDAQDYQLSEFRVGAFDPVKKTVEVGFKNYGKPVIIVYSMDKTPVGWRISDIRYQKGSSMKKLLSMDGDGR